MFNTGSPPPAKMLFDDNGTAQYSTESATITISDAGPFGFKRPIPFHVERTENGIILGNTDPGLDHLPAYCCAWKHAILADLNPKYLDSSRIRISSFAAWMKSADSSLCINDLSCGHDLMHEGIFPILVTDIIVVAQHEQIERQLQSNELPRNRGIRLLLILHPSNITSRSRSL